MSDRDPNSGFRALEAQSLLTVTLSAPLFILGYTVILTLWYFHIYVSLYFVPVHSLSLMLTLPLCPASIPESFSIPIGNWN